MLTQILRLDEASKFWNRKDCRKSPAEIERLIWAFFWLGAFQKQGRSSFGFIAQRGPDRGRFVPMFREVLIGAGERASRLGEVTGTHEYPITRADAVELALGHRDSADRKRLEGDRKKLKKQRRKIARLLDERTLLTASVPTPLDFKRAARMTSNDYEAGKRDPNIGEIIENAAVELTALVSVCQRRGIPYSKFRQGSGRNKEDPAAVSAAPTAPSTAGGKSDDGGASSDVPSATGNVDEAEFRRWFEPYITVHEHDSKHPSEPEMVQAAKNHFRLRKIPRLRSLVRSARRPPGWNKRGRTPGS